MQNDMKRQHYVWKNYLKPWLVDGKIWCKRNSSIFNTSPENIALEKFFYYADPLNETELFIVKSIIHLSHPTAQSTLLDDLMIYRTASEVSEQSRKNKIEEYHGAVENSVIDIMDRLCKKDRGFLTNEKKKAHFCYFVGLQQTRTKKTRQASIVNLKNIVAPPGLLGKYDPAKLEKAFSLIFAEFLGNWMHSKAGFYFLECPEDAEFITSDQPVFNIHKGSDPTTPPDRVELLYPISPKLALFITEKESETDRIIDFNECARINRKIYLESYEQIFATDPAAFRKIEETGSLEEWKGG